MNLVYITQYMDRKIEENVNKVTITFFELRIKEDLSQEDTYIFLRMSKQRLTNLGYKIYDTGEKYMYNGKEEEVKSNEFYVAIKE